jgi:hypothetical protein
MPFVTFTVRRGLSAADKSRLSEAMLEAQVAAGYHRADRFHRFLEVDQDDLLVDPRFPDYATDRTDRFMVVEVVISSGRPTGTAATIADEAVRLFGERLQLAPQDILFVFHEVEPNLPRFPAASIRREATGCLNHRSATSSWKQRKSIERGTNVTRSYSTGRFSYPRSCHTTSRCMRDCDPCTPISLICSSSRSSPISVQPFSTA